MSVWKKPLSFEYERQNFLPQTPPPPRSPPDQRSFRFRRDLSAYSDTCLSLSSSLCSHTSFTYPIGGSVKYLWPCRKWWTHMWRGVSCPGFPDVLDITEACQLCGWALNGSLSLISHSSFTMTPLFSCYYSTPGGSVWKSWPDEYGLRICCWDMHTYDWGPQSCLLKIWKRL